MQVPGLHLPHTNPPPPYTNPVLGLIVRPRDNLKPPPLQRTVLPQRYPETSKMRQEWAMQENFQE